MFNLYDKRQQRYFLKCSICPTLSRIFYARINVIYLIRFMPSYLLFNLVYQHQTKSGSVIRGSTLADTDTVLYASVFKRYCFWLDRYDRRWCQFQNSDFKIIILSQTLFSWKLQRLKWEFWVKYIQIHFSNVALILLRSAFNRSVCLTITGFF